MSIWPDVAIIYPAGPTPSGFVPIGNRFKAAFFLILAIFQKTQYEAKSSILGFVKKYLLDQDFFAGWSKPPPPSALYRLIRFE